MIVCSCNLITENDIRALLRQPQAPECVRDVYASLGCTQDCGGCVGGIAHMIEEARLKDGTTTQADRAKRRPDLQSRA